MFCSIFREDAEDSLQVLDVLRGILRSDQYVVDVNEYPWYVAENGVHQPLKILSGVFKAERCSWKFKEAERSYDRGLPDVVAGYRNLVIAFHKVYLREDSLPMEIRVEIAYRSNGISVVRC